MPYRLIFRLFLLILFSGAMTPLRAGSADSLLLKLRRETNPGKKANLQLEYFNRKFSSSPEATMRQLDSLIRAAEKQGASHTIARAKSLNCWFLFSQARYEESLKLGHEALNMQMVEKDSLGIALTLNRIGCVNLQYGRFADAKTYLEKSLAYSLALKDLHSADGCYNNLGVLANAENKRDQGMAYYKKALAIRLSQQDYHWIAYSYFNIGQAYLEADQSDSAKAYLLKAISTFREKTKAHKVPPMVNGGMAQYYAATGQYAEALPYARMCVRDAEATGAIDVLIPSEMMLAGLLYETKNYKEAYEAYDAYVTLAERRDSTGNAAAIAGIEEKYKNAEKEKEIALLSAKKLEAENKVQQTGLLAFCVVIGALVFAGMIGFSYLKRKQRQKLKESAYQAKLAEVRLTALRAQMNPHFVFNCINTAQGFILDEHKEQGYDYLSDFARLLRMVLENSGKTLIPLDSEISQIRLYLDLESIRFRHKFSYELHLDPQLENGVYEVPGMILQPFIENAILHGLVNRAGSGGLLRITMRLQDERIYCEIADNGIGREKAAEIKRQKKVYYQSSATPNIRQRLEIMNALYAHTISFEIIDLFHDGSAAGTLVKVYLPFQ